MTDKLITIDLDWIDHEIHARIKGQDKPLCRFTWREPITSDTRPIDIMACVNKAADLLNTPIYGIEHDRHFLFFHTDPLTEEPENAS